MYCVLYNDIEAVCVAVAVKRGSQNGDIFYVTYRKLSYRKRSIRPRF